MSNLQLLPTWFVASYMFFIGLCIGSFLNVVILRGLSGEDIVFARSKCPKCNNHIKWYMNIPVFSYIFLRGKCAFCKEKISIQYPLVELICALLFLATYFAFGLGIKMIFIWIFLSLFIAMSVTDLKQTVIIDYHAYILLAAGLIYSYLNLGDINIIQSLIGAAFGFLIFEIMARIGKMLVGCRMFGEGDSLIALGLGAIFGWKVVCLIIALSIFIQCVVTIPILARGAFVQNKIKLAISYILVFVSILLICLNNHFKFLQDGLVYYACVAVVVALLIWSLKQVLNEINQKKNDDTKNEEEKFNLLPFGPALLISATICVFYLGWIKKYILDFIGQV